MVDVPLPHLDRPFDYAVPDNLDAEVQPGSRVRVRFAGRLVDAFVLDRVEDSEHDGKLAYVERGVGEPVLTPQTAALFEAVATRYAGSFVDVVRLGVPPRHATAESAPSAAAPVPEAPVKPGLAGYHAGAAFLAAIRDRRPARAVWSALPGEDWAARLAEAIRTALAAGRGAVAVVPDARDLDRLDAAMRDELDPACYVVLAADLGPAERYRRWLAVRRGAVRAVIGTRAAGYAPVADAGLFAIWDDGDDLHAEPRAPYPHSRDVLVQRSVLEGAALLVGGFARTAEAQLLVDSGWAHEVAADRATVRKFAARVIAVGDDVEQSRDPAATAARLPSLAWRTARDALAAERPVLVQVPRRGYAPSLACQRDRTPARCVTCHGPLAATSGHAIAACRWCGRLAGNWVCPNCGGQRLRAVVVGSVRTAEELGRAFPSVPVRVSGGDRVLANVGARAELVVATPGAEPVADDGYGAALLLDGWALLSRPDLRAAEETLRRWMNAAALVRSDGIVVVGADAAVPAVQALVRWDPAGSARRELADRAELGFPPAVRMAAVTGAAGAVAELVSMADLPGDADVIGPVPAERGEERLLIRVPRARGSELAHALKTAASLRSSRKAPDPVRITLDPQELG
jgi:primosomal protein N' (replication factor Y)